MLNMLEEIHMSEVPRSPRKRGAFLAILLFAFAFAAGCVSRSYIDGFFDRGGKPVGTPTPTPTGEGWINLLDAANAPLWKNLGDDKDIFEVRDGVLHIFGRTVYPLRYATFTGQTFGDFDLHVEFKVTRGANSGLFLRTAPNAPENRGFELQVIDDHGKNPTKNSCGAIYDVVTPMFNVTRPAGEWNSYDISVRGKMVTVTMNGWKIIDADFSKLTAPVGKFPIAYNDLPLEGYIAFQDHGGEVWYRNVMIKPVTAN
ncbi:MAG: DUF1080 domain-containing protein [Candidatus Hydrogenedentes bacterium]|nr:DUF1080 domain-containing protein [Candidatus Hydrogenedentota bacterium]